MAIVNDTGGNPLNRSGSIAYAIGSNVSWTFKGPRVSVDLSCQPVWDESRRTAVYHRYVLSLRAFVTDDEAGLTAPDSQTSGDADTDRSNVWASLAKIRSVLSRPGGRLIVEGYGVDMDINSGTGFTFVTAPNSTPANTYMDVGWGPRTMDLKFVNHGGGLVYEVFWQVEFCVVECGLTATQPSSVSAGDPREFNFSVRYSVDTKGLTTRDISGYYVVYNHRQSIFGGAVNRIQTTAEEFWDDINPAPVPGFQRSRSRDLSMDKSRMNFSITDQQINSKTPYPKRVTDISLKHTVSTSGTATEEDTGSLGLTINHRLSGFVEVSMAGGLEDAWDTLVAILQQRVDIMRQNADVWITSLMLAEEVFGPPRIDYTMTLIQRPELENGIFSDLIGRTGLFIPPDNIPSGEDGWQEWSASMSPDVHSHRGLSNLEFTTSQESIVSGCDLIEGTSLSDFGFPVALVDGGASLTTGCGSGDYRSYLDWKNDIRIEADNESIAAASLSETGTVTSITLEDGVGLEIGAPVKTFDNVRMIHSFIRSEIKIYIVGRAIRAGQLPELPSVIHDLSDLVDPDGDPLLKQERAVYTPTKGGLLGTCRVWKLEWQVVFSLIDGSRLPEVLAELNLNLSVTPDDPEGLKVGNQ